MKALVFEQPEQPVVKEIQQPVINDDELLIKSTMVGICHSDYELLAGRYIIPISYPVVPGHEWCGTVVDAGRQVKDFQAGDRVVGECVINTPEQVHHFGFSMDGANREYFCARPEWLHKLPASINDVNASMIEPFTCGFYALLRNGGTHAGETVVVSGGGTIGLMTAAAAAGMGARTIVIDPVAKRRETAIKLGAEAAIDPSVDGSASETIARLTNGKGADLAVEASGHNSSLENIFDYVREEGRVSMVGINIGNKINVELGKIQIKNLQVRGCIGSPGVWPQAIKFLEQTGIDLSPIQTHQFDLDKSVDAFELGKDPQQSIKIGLKIS